VARHRFAVLLAVVLAFSIAIPVAFAWIHAYALCQICLGGTEPIGLETQHRIFEMECGLGDAHVNHGLALYASDGSALEVGCVETTYAYEEQIYCWYYRDTTTGEENWGYFGFQGVPLNRLLYKGLKILPDGTSFCVWGQYDQLIVSKEIPLPSNFLQKSYERYWRAFAEFCDKYDKIDPDPDTILYCQDYKAWFMDRGGTWRGIDINLVSVEWILEQYPCDGWTAWDWGKWGWTINYLVQK